MSSAGGLLRRGCAMARTSWNTIFMSVAILALPVFNHRKPSAGPPTPQPEHPPKFRNPRRMMQSAFPSASLGAKAPMAAGPDLRGLEWRLISE